MKIVNVGKSDRLVIGKRAGILGILLNLALFAAKLYAGLASGAISITTDAVNNISDAGSSFITLIGFKMAGKRPDIDLSLIHI